MPPADFHDKPFDKGTLTKLRLFELYTREWLPVFLAQQRPRRSEIHVFDFFAGPGMDARGELGSPLRVLRQLTAFGNLPGWSKVSVHAHFFDANPAKIAALRDKVNEPGRCPEGVTLDIQPLKFRQALQSCARALGSPTAAKLLFIDQLGVDKVTPEIFRRLVALPTCDFLFFLTSSTLHRFHDHPAIKHKITRPNDYYQVHRAVLDYYRGLLPKSSEFFLAPFSIKKGANIYGLIFGSANPLGMDKFLQVAWKTDQINGEADFDINRDDIRPGEPMLPLAEWCPTKVTAFERELEERLRSGEFRDEAAIMRLCFEHGVKRQHAGRILGLLKKLRVIEVDFRLPQIDRWNSPRPIRLLPRVR